MGLSAIWQSLRAIYSGPPAVMAMQGWPTAPILQPLPLIPLPQDRVQLNAPAAPQSPNRFFGYQAASAARTLIQNGYVYPRDLKEHFRYVPGKIGCCADLVCDAYKQAGFDLYGEMVKHKLSPHGVGSQVEYFRKYQQLLSAKAQAEVGDAVFISSERGVYAHVAVVTAVDDQGHPTKVAESYDLNTRAAERDFPPARRKSIVGYGRLVA